MPQGIFGQLPAGLRGYVAAEQNAQARDANQLARAQGIFGLQEAMEMKPLQRALLQAQVAQAQQDADIMKRYLAAQGAPGAATGPPVAPGDMSTPSGPVNAYSGQPIPQAGPSGAAGALPESVRLGLLHPRLAPLAKEEAAMLRHESPGGAARLSAQTTREGQGVTIRGQDLTDARAREGQALADDRFYWETGIRRPGRGGAAPGPAIPSAPGPAPGLRPIPGLPPKEAAALAGKRAEEQPAAMRRLESARAKHQIIDDTVTEALAILGQPSGIVPAIKGAAGVGTGNLPTTGFIGSALSNVAGTEAYKLQEAIKPVLANLGFAELQAMRESSPTGGALGQIAVRELEYLQAAVRSLAQGQDPETLSKNLKAVQKHFSGWRSAVERSYEQQYGKPNQGQSDPLGIR